MGWFCMTDPKTGKILATNVKHVETTNKNIRDEDGKVIDTIDPEMNVISSDEVYVDPDFEKSWSNFLKKQNDESLKQQCDEEK